MDKPTYFVPQGGHPPQTDLLTGRAVFTDAYAVMKVLVRCGTAGRISIMVNMARNREEALQVHERIASVARQFLKTDIAFSGFVVADTAVQQAVRKRAPFVQQYPNSAAAQCVQAWANRSDHSVDVRQMPGKPGFFARLASWWR